MKFNKAAIKQFTFVAFVAPQRNLKLISLWFLPHEKHHKNASEACEHALKVTRLADTLYKYSEWQSNGLEPGISDVS